MTSYEAVHKELTDKLKRILQTIAQQPAHNKTQLLDRQHAYRVVESKIRYYDRALAVSTYEPTDPRRIQAQQELGLIPGDNGAVMDWSGRKHGTGRLSCQACLWTPRRVLTQVFPRVPCCEICLVCGNGVVHVVERCPTCYGATTLTGPPHESCPDCGSTEGPIKHGPGGFQRDYSGLPPTLGVTNSPGTAQVGLTQAVIPVKTRCDGCGVESWGEIQYVNE